MKKIELLAPAGNIEALKAAVFNGADAIYCGGSNFGARAYAGNFNRDEMIEAINFCHLYGVKIYITMNTLVYEDEFDNAIQEVDFYYHNNADALIIQDLGLFDYIRKVYPEFEVHCSTQMHIHNVDGVKFMKEKGASRVVLARESSIETIQKCTKEGIEIEVFTYGALCVSYSGQCLMSSITQSRSGNRGTCAQCCRMQYDLVNLDTNKTIETTGKYLLSPKDLNVIEQLPLLIDAGVASLKIEGRMKRAEYVALVVRTFREAIDAYYQNKKYNLTQDRLNELKLMFNRQFTKGHIFHDSGLKLMNPLRPNHIGLVLGEVVKATQDSIDVKLKMDLHQHDGLRILDEREDIGFTANKIYLDGRLVNYAQAGETVTFDCPYFVKKNSVVVKTSDVKLLDSCNINTIKSYQVVPLKCTVIAKIGEPLSIEITDNNNHSVEVKSEFLCQEAMNRAVTKEQFYDQINKLKETPYYISEFDGDFQNVFIPLKEINEIRRVAIDKLNICRKSTYQRCEKSKYTSNITFNDKLLPTMIEVNTFQQADLLQNSGVLLFSSRKDVLLKYPSIYPMNLIANENSVYQFGEFTLINDLGNLCNIEGTLICTSNFNVTNSYALAFLLENGISFVTLSHELTSMQKQELVRKFMEQHHKNPPLVHYFYGCRDLMITKACIVNEFLSDGLKKNCSLCKNNSFALKDIKGSVYRFMGDDDCIQHILEEQPFLDDDVNFGSLKFIRLTHEKDDVLRSIISNYINDNR